MSCSFVYTTPSHQFPLGITMPAARRIKLLEYCLACEAYIIEDDYDSEFRYDTGPITSFQELAPEKVIYIGTFSKTLSPALRIAYIIFPPELIKQGRELKWFADLHNATIDQLVLSRFIKEGFFSRHIHKMKKIYSKKRDVLVTQLEKSFPGQIEIYGHPAGIHLTARFKGIRFTKQVIEELKQKGVKVYPVEEHTITKRKYRESLIMGYGLLTPEGLKEGVRLMADYFERKSSPF